MTIIADLKTYFSTADLTKDFPLNVDYLGNEPIGNALISMPGSGAVEEYIAGGGMYEFLFAFQSKRYTDDELNRIDALGFLESLSNWFQLQNLRGALPLLSDESMTSFSLEATDGGYLFEKGDSGTAIYQIQCRLVYEKRGIPPWQFKV